MAVGDRTKTICKGISNDTEDGISNQDSLQMSSDTRRRLTESNGRWGLDSDNLQGMNTDTAAIPRSIYIYRNI